MTPLAGRWAVAAVPALAVAAGARVRRQPGRRIREQRERALRDAPETYADLGHHGRAVAGARN